MVVCGKVSKPTEFGDELNLSIDEYGFARFEYPPFEAYNKGTMLIHMLEADKYHHGCYPARVLVDQIYRTRPNNAFARKMACNLAAQGLADRQKANKSGKCQDS